jgi:CRP-like cAMP-binding protein
MANNGTAHKHELDIPSLLSRMPLFSALTPGQLAPITAATREKRLAKGEMLFQKGDMPKGFFIIVFGQVKLAFPSDTLLLHISKEAVLRLLETDVTFARAMLAGLAMRLHSLIGDVESYSLRSSAQRVIGYLLQHCPHDGECEERLEFTLPTSKQVIASRLNLTPETLSRIFHDLAEGGLIEVHGRQIMVPDLARLREYDL